MKNAATKQHSIINDVTKENNEKKELLRPSGGVVAITAPNIGNEERLRQQQQQQQIKQRQQQILQFQQQIQQQQQQQHNLHTVQNQLSTSQNPQPTTQQQQQQQRRCIVPHAYALYDFESNESSDLKFKKGDLIFLKRKIDSNWYVGQVKGVEGNFPINYVQVLFFF